ncbi:MAG: response regulator, partial [Nitrososphaeraceae archaeon]
IYASVYIDKYDDSSLIETVFSKIIDYNENLKNKNLKFINFKPYYESALKGDLTLFEELKVELNNELKKRISEEKKGKILLFADAACHLSENRYFYECQNLEKWWQDTNLEWSRNNKNITVICPHLDYVFKADEQEVITRNKINNFHDATINVEDEHYLEYFYNLITQYRQIKILIAEPNDDMHYVYRQFLKECLKDIKVTIVGNGRKCVDYLLDSKDKGENEQFDMIIVDSHLPDMDGIEVIKKIRKEIPNQRIIFTTTNSFSEIKNIIDLFGINKNDILLKPFSFTKLISVINPLITIK